MKTRADKCHVLITTNEERHIPVGGEKYKIIKVKKVV